MLSISIVSHGQLELVRRLLQSLEASQPQTPLQVLVTENRGGARGATDVRSSLDVTTIVNPEPRGLAANINAAFRLARGELFCILNPDVVFTENVIDPLVQRLAGDPDAIRAPLVIDEDGWVQDSARSLPTPGELLFRRISPGRMSMAEASRLTDQPDWVAGVMLVLPSALFRRVGGLNESYYLYFEDVEFCTRARLAGARIHLDKDLRVVHHARRRSRRNPVYTLRHLASALRFFRSPVYRQARKLRS